MGAVYFYHLTRRPLEASLPVLLEKALKQDWRVVVRGTDTARLGWLDEKLWLGREDGFLPHGLSGGPHDDLQPVLLTADPGLTGDCLMCIDGAEVSAAEVRDCERVCVLFDGNEAQAVDRARGQWKALTGAGCAAKYWSEEGGRWEMKRETGA